jgi:hypothetical protein
MIIFPDVGECTSVADVLQCDQKYSNYFGGKLYQMIIILKKKNTRKIQDFVKKNNKKKSFNNLPLPNLKI